jgi:hypothetical protein
MSDAKRLIKVKPEAYEFFKRAFAADYKTKAGQELMKKTADDLDNMNVENSWGWLPWSAQDDLQNLAGILRERAAGDFVGIKKQLLKIVGVDIDDDFKKEKSIKTSSTNVSTLYSKLVERKNELQKKDPYSLEVLQLSNELDNLAEYHPNYHPDIYDKKHIDDVIPDINKIVNDLFTKYFAKPVKKVEQTQVKGSESQIKNEINNSVSDLELAKRMENEAKGIVTPPAATADNTGTGSTQKKRVGVTPPAAPQPDADGLYEMDITPEEAKMLGL